MADGYLVKEFREEATCSICLDYLKEPVTIECGHSFCHSCLLRFWDESEPSCPQCRVMIEQRNFRPSQQLVNFVELVKRLENKKGVECGMCESHQEPLKLFCKDDLAIICVVCERSCEHRDHSVLPMEEASEEYKEKIQAQIRYLEAEIRGIMAQRIDLRESNQESLKWLTAETSRATSAFQAMQQFLEKKKYFWLSQFGILERKIIKRENENLTRVSDAVGNLWEVINELERKCEQPVSVFLQDIKSTLSSCEREPRKQLIEIFPEHLETLGAYGQTNYTLKEAVKSCKESLEQALHEVNVTLDPDTAHPLLILSDDGRSVRRGEAQDGLPESPLGNPERFDMIPCVLGRKKFTSGRHWWLMELEGPLAQWAVGVARVSVKRKGEISLNPKEGIWAIRKNVPCMNLLRSDREFSALTYPNPTTLNLNHKPWKIRVSLDYDEGCIGFSDAVTDTPIFTFLSSSFFGESLCPFFCLYSEASVKC